MSARLYAVAGQAIDGLADQSAADLWLGDLVHRLPQTDLPPGAWPSVAEIVALRDNVRVALHAAIEAGPQNPAALEAINAASARAPMARWRLHAPPELGTTYLSATRADVVLGAFASDAVELLTGPRREDLRACGAPGCVLLYLKTILDGPGAPTLAATARAKPATPTRAPHRSLKHRPTRSRLPPGGSADPVARLKSTNIGPSASLAGWAGAAAIGRLRSP
jgi:predicted RNA-binding Zn ribbon-like protein